MKKRFKKIYIEITNRCNLNCSFCKNTKRKKEDMSLDTFKKVIDKIKKYTDYVYLHLKGEPLIHPSLEEFIDYCFDNDIKVNLTINGTLLKENVDKLKKIRELNISLHSENNDEYYLDKVIDSAKKLSKNTYISYRLWTLEHNKLDDKEDYIIKIIKEKYNLSTEIVDKIKKEKSVKIDINTYVDKNNKFEWPNEANSDDEKGYCYGLNSHIGILVDGTVVPCCLDGEGEIPLGNIYKEELEDILNKKRAKKIIEGFKRREAVETLCKKCSYKDRF